MLELKRRNKEECLNIILAAARDRADYLEELADEWGTWADQEEDNNARDAYLREAKTLRAAIEQCEDSYV
jgi:hypothetical protein